MCFKGFRNGIRFETILRYSFSWLITEVLHLILLKRSTGYSIPFRCSARLLRSKLPLINRRFWALSSLFSFLVKAYPSSGLRLFLLCFSGPSRASFATSSPLTALYSFSLQSSSVYKLYKIYFIPSKNLAKSRVTRHLGLVMARIPNCILYKKYTAFLCKVPNTQQNLYKAQHLQTPLFYYIFLTSTSLCYHPPVFIL